VSRILVSRIGARWPRTCPRGIPAASTKQSAVMQARVAYAAERNQIVFNIGAGLAAKLFVMNLEIRH